MSFGAFFDSQFEEHAAVLAATRAGLRAPFLRLVEVCTEASRGGGKIVFFGNGGSAADAQHLATELTVRYVRDRPPIAALALTTDTSALTAIGNDLGFERLFARQIDGALPPGRRLHRHLHLRAKRERHPGPASPPALAAASPPGCWAAMAAGLPPSAILS